MPALSKQTIQRLAVLHALAKWQKGAYGPVRLQKTLFFADKESPPEWRLFTFKKWRLGQYSDEVSESLNALRRAGRVNSWYDGPSERLKAEIPAASKRRLAAVLRDYFPEWSANLDAAFAKWAYLNNDAIIELAHDDPTYKARNHGEVIFSSFEPDCVELVGLDDESAEELSDLVDVRLQRGLAKRLAAALERPAQGEDWRKIYFAESHKS